MLRHESIKGNVVKHRPTPLLYMYPILFGLLGGIMMYIAVHDKDQELANDSIFWGLLSTISMILIYVVLTGLFIPVIL